jgi:hypothetical protein
VTFVGSTPVPPADAPFSPPPIVGAVDDPLFGRRLPTVGGSTVSGTTTCDDASPRLRSGRTYVDIVVADGCRMRGGVYRITGSFIVQAGVDFSPGNVTLVFVNSATFLNNGGPMRLDHAGGTNFSLVWQSSSALNLGAAELAVDGDVYAPSADVVVAGQVDINGALVASSLTLTPPAELSIDADADSSRVTSSGLALTQ